MILILTCPSSSSTPWSSLVVGSLRSWEPRQIIPYVSIACLCLSLWFLIQSTQWCSQTIFQYLLCKFFYLNWYLGVSGNICVCYDVSIAFQISLFDFGFEILTSPLASWHPSLESHFCCLEYLNLWRDCPSFSDISEDRYYIRVHQFSFVSNETFLCLKTLVSF